jgi:hypothetical protein
MRDIQDKISRKAEAGTLDFDAIVIGAGATEDYGRLTMR